MATYRPEESTPTQKRKVLAEIPTVGEYISPIDPAQSKISKKINIECNSVKILSNHKI